MARKQLPQSDAARTWKGAPHRPRWWTELPLIALVYLAYSACRLLARGDVSTAVDHGLAILKAERTLHLDIERP